MKEEEKTWADNFIENLNYSYHNMIKYLIQTGCSKQSAIILAKNLDLLNYYLKCIKK